MVKISEALQIAREHCQAGRLDLAEEICRRILAAEPDHARALHLLGIIARQRGQPEVALECIARAIRLNGAEAAFHNSLANVFKSQAKLDEAVVSYRRALELAPNHAGTHYNLGLALHDQGKLDDAVACFRRALELKPDFAKAHNNLGIAFNKQGKLGEAAACYRRALDARPDYVEAHSNLGIALQDQGKLEEAVACYRRALELRPDFAELHYNLGTALQRQGMVDEAIECFREAVRLDPELHAAWHDYLCALRYRPEIGPAELRAAYAGYAQRHLAPLPARRFAHGNSRDAERPLRLGFVSPKFCTGPVGSFLIRALENLDRAQFPLFCYSTRHAADAMAARFQAVSDGWRDGLQDREEDLAALIRADQIDILFDLAGHAPFDSLRVFARKPAPIQITWIDSVGTTGLAAIDYILADRYEIPAQAEPHYAEKVLCLPDSYVCFDPPHDAPPVAPLPALAKGYVTFASFNQCAKIQRPVVELWSRILRRVPNSRLLLKYHGFDDAGARRRYHALFAAGGVPAERLEFQGGSPHAEFIAAYNQVDVALDPLYNGGVTTCEALWMGAPVVTYPGATFPRRHSLSHLSSAGLTETIAGDLDGYVDRAVALASDLPRLAAIRAGLRQRVAASPLCDGKRFAANLMSLLRGVWRDWCGGPGQHEEG